jgi:hypothetical protein
MAESASLFAQWDSILPANASNNFIVEKSGSLFKDGADHNVFLDARIPGVLFSTGLTQHYHRPSDDEGTINYPGMAAINRYVMATISNAQRMKLAYEWKRL